MSGNSTSDNFTVVGPDLVVYNTSLYTTASTPTWPSDVVWVLVSAGMIFYMQMGFMFLEAGGIRRKNQRNSMTKAFVGICMSAITFYLIGYGLGFGNNHQAFGGTTMFAGDSIDCNRNWCFQYAFCVTYVAITLSAIQERTRFEVYFILVPIISGITYPIVVSWTWGLGWLFQMGYVDFAGSSIVHLAGAMSALAVSICVGPREGKFTTQTVTTENRENQIDAENENLEKKIDRLNNDDENIEPGHPSPLGLNEEGVSRKGKENFNYEKVTAAYEAEMGVYNVTYYGMGVMTLWFGWLYFNGGSTLSTQEGAQEQAEKAVMNSIVGPSAGGLVGMIARKYIAGGSAQYRAVNYDPVGLLNGVLCGLVAITANCAYIDAWAAITIGGLAPIFYSLSIRLLDKLKLVDDAAEAFPIHGPCGAWGIFATAFFHQTEGVFYGYNGKTVGIQILGIVVISAWDMLTIFSVLMPIKYISLAITKRNWLRLTPEEEIAGADMVDHIYVEDLDIQAQKRHLQKNSI